MYGIMPQYGLVPHSGGSMRRPVIPFTILISAGESENDMAIKVGILGFAHGHVGSYGAQIMQHPEWGLEFVAGWDHDAGRAEKSCANFKIPALESPEAVIALSDAIIVSSETVYHADLVVKAADAGKQIICYKPMALRMEEADRMVEAVERNKVPFTLGYQMRVDPQNIRMKELITDGTLGKICLFRRRHCLSTHLWGNFEDTWHNSEFYNRDIFADDASHPIDMMNWIFGVPETVSCELSTVVNPKVPNDVGVSTFKYANGTICEISCCFSCCAAEITTEIYGSKGSVQQYYGDGVSTGLARPEGQPGLKWMLAGDKAWTDSGIPSPAGHGERIAAQGEQFAAFLRGEREPICSVYEARNSLRMVLASYVSAKYGERVRIDDPRVYEI